MKTKTKNLKRLVKLLILIIGIGFSNAANACSASFTSIIGANGNVTFNNTSTGFTAAGIYEWNFGDGFWSLNKNTSHTYSANGTYWVKLMGWDSITSCRSFDSAQISITNIACTLSTSFTSASTSGGSFTFTSTSTGVQAGMQYYWNPGDGSGFHVGSSVFNYTYANTGNYWVSLIIQNASGLCNDSTGKQATVTSTNAGATECAVGLTDSINANGNVTFYAHPTNETAGTTYYDYYIWYPGDGTGPFYSFYNNSFSHTYPSNGNYTMRVTMVDSAVATSCYATDSMQVIIGNAGSGGCILNASFNVTYGANGEATFTSTSTGTGPSTIYNWSVGPYTAITRSPVFNYTYSVNGVYSAFLVIIDSTGLCSAGTSDIQQVTITTGDSTNTCSLSITDTTYANGLYTFYAHHQNSAGVYSGTYYIWYPGDGTGPFTTYTWENTLNHTYPSNGTYKMYVTAIDSTPSSCYSTDSITVNVNNIAPGTCNLNAGFNVYYGGNGAVTFTSTSTGTYSGTRYYWIPGDGSGAVLGGTSFNYVYASNGNYAAALILIDSNGLCNDSVVNYVTISNVSGYTNTCNLSANFTTSVGSNGQVNFTSTSTGVTSSTVYWWIPGNYVSGSFPYAYGAGLTNYTYTYPNNGTYYAYLMLYDTISGCYDWTWNIVTINTAAPCGLTANFTDNIGSGGNVTFTSTSTGTNSSTVYQWDPGDGTGLQYGSSTFNYTYYYSGTYNVLLNISDSLGGCNSMDTMSITINNADSCLYANYYDSMSTATYIAYDSSTGKMDTVTYTVCNFYSISDTVCSDSTGRRISQRVLGGSNEKVEYMWNFGDGSKMSGLGLTNPSHHYAVPGQYTTSLAIKFKGSVHQSRAVHSIGSSPLGVPTITPESSSGLSLYPNPNTGQFKVSLSNVPSGQTPEIHITNVLGEEVYNSTSEASGNRLTKDIDLNASPGMYFVKIVTSGKVFTTKMIIGR